MRKIINTFKKIFLSVPSGGIYMVLIAIAIAIATFIENDYGTNTAQKLVFKSRWFELLLILFALTSIYNVIVYKLYRLKKLPIFLFHLSIPIIILGAGITRYFGIEGSMHLREGKKSNQITSRDAYLKFEAIEGDNEYQINEKVLFSSLGKNNFSKSYLFRDKQVDVDLMELIPNPIMKVSNTNKGQPKLKVVVSTKSGRKDILIEYEKPININGVVFNFNDKLISQALNIKLIKDSLYMMFDKPLEVMEMVTQKLTSLPPNQWHPLKMKSLYRGAGNHLVFNEFFRSGGIVWDSKSKKLDGKSEVLIKLMLSSGGESEIIDFKGNENYISNPKTIIINGIKFRASYGPKIIQLPFYISLKDFILKKYIGTNNPSSYESMVQVQDPEENIQFDYHIYMNHILNYKGYRFFQSSYDPDELGSILSVNQDFYGTIVTYIGYFLITIGLVISLFVKNGRMRKLSIKLDKLKNS